MLPPDKIPHTYYVHHSVVIYRGGLREGTRVLLDPLDQHTFDDLLAGKEVEPTASKGREKE